MNKQTLIEALSKNYHSFINYINSLTIEECSFSYQQKWTAGQQLEHIVLCIKPLVQVFSMDKPAIVQTFGVADRPGITYDALLTNYKEKFKEGGKAPERFVPEPVSPDQRELLSETLKKLTNELCSKIDSFTEQELDSLCIPHPLLGKLTLREMLYNAIYHVEHHHKQAQQNLRELVSK